MTFDKSKKIIEEKKIDFSDVKASLGKTLGDIAKTLEEIRECADGQVPENKHPDHVGKDKLIKLNMLICQFSFAFEQYRQIKGDIDEDQQRGLSTAIKELQENTNKIIQYLSNLKNVYKSSHFTESLYFENRLKEFNEKLDFYRKAALPYEPPKFSS